MRPVHFTPCAGGAVRAKTPFVLTALALMALTASSPRIIVCGPLLESRARPRILPRTAPTFSPLVHAPDSLDEPRARPRSFAELPGSPALENEGPRVRPFTFRHHPRAARR